jgi:hypothetical protein
MFPLRRRRGDTRAEKEMMSWLSTLKAEGWPAKPNQLAF